MVPSFNIKHVRKRESERERETEEVGTSPTARSAVAGEVRLDLRLRNAEFFFLRHHVPIIYTNNYTMKQHLSAGSIRSDRIVLSQSRVKVDSDDFSSSATSGSNATWTPFNPALMDGGIVTNTKGLLVLNWTKQPFTAPPNPSTLDHVKYLAFKNGPDLLNSKIGGTAGLCGAYAAPKASPCLIMMLS